MPKNSEDDPSQGHRLSIVRLAAYVRNFLKLISTDYWPATFAFSIIVLGSVIMFLLELLLPILSQLLAASRSTPWGVVTSIFIHASFLHLGENIIALSVYFFLFTTTNFRLQGNERRFRAFFLSWNIFLSAILADVLYIVLSPVPSLGASGVAYAFEAVMLGFALANLMPFGANAREVKQHYRQNRKRVVYNFLVFAAFFIWLLVSPSQFVSAAPGINIFAHGIAFILSLISTLLYVLVPPFKRWADELSTHRKYPKWAVRFKSHSLCEAAFISRLQFFNPTPPQ